MSRLPSFALAAPASFAGAPVPPRAPRPHPRPRVAARRVRATATEADPERPPNVDVADDAFEQHVPGKIVLSELQLAQQRTALEQYAKELRKKRLAEEREAARLFGWVPYAETLNGRLAMFFFVTGLLTEYWTGYTIPEQVELMLRTLGIL